MNKETNVGEYKDVKQRKSKSKLARERELAELQYILSTSGGRWWLWKILEECRLFEGTSYHTPQHMAVASGKRDIGIWLLKEINEADKNGYTKLIDEDKDRNG